MWSTFNDTPSVPEATTTAKIRRAAEKSWSLHQAAEIPPEAMGAASDSASNFPIIHVAVSDFHIKF